MTSVAGADSRLRIDASEALASQSRSELAEHVAMVVLLVFWAVPFTRATGGRGVHHELLFAGLMLVLLPAMRAWRAPARSVVMAGVVSVAALLVCVFAPSHWYGSDVAAGYAIGAAVFVAARRYVRDAERRLLVATCVCLAALYQFEQAFVPWWGSRNAATEMSGTFYWHNPYAAFLLPGALLGVGLILLRRRPWSLVGWLSTPICTAGIVFSSSRATMAVLAVGWALAAALCVRDKAGALRMAGAVTVTVGVLAILPGPPFFPHYSAPWTATTARAASNESLAQNGEYRIQFWREAIDVTAHRPLVGSGYHDLADAGALYTPVAWARSPLAHNGYLQALSDGGLLLGLPVLLAAAAIIWWGLRRLLRALRARPDPHDALEICIALALLALMAHSAVDFDWSHPSILIEVVLLAAATAPARAAARARFATGVALACLAGVLVVHIPALHEWQQNQPDLRYSTNHLLGEASQTFGNYRPAEVVLFDYARGGRPLSAAQAARALQLTASQAAVDLHLALLRDAVGAKAGLMPDAVSRARLTLGAVGGVVPAYLPDFALVLSSAGEASAAQHLLSGDIAAQVSRGLAAPNLLVELQQWAEQFGTGSSYACIRGTAAPILTADQLAGLPKPTASCEVHDQGHA